MWNKLVPSCAFGTLLGLSGIRLGKLTWWAGNWCLLIFNYFTVSNQLVYSWFLGVVLIHGIDIMVASTFLYDFAQGHAWALVGDIVCVYLKYILPVWKGSVQQWLISPMSYKVIIPYICSTQLWQSYTVLRWLSPDGTWPLGCMSSDAC